MTCTQQTLDQLVDEFDRWKCKEHELEKKDRAQQHRDDFVKRYARSKIDVLTPLDLYNPGPGNEYFFRSIAFTLTPLGGIGNPFPLAFREAAARIDRFRPLLRLALDDTASLASKIDADWGSILGFGGDNYNADRVIAKKIVATYYPDDTMPIFNQANMEHFVHYLHLDKEVLARNRHGKSYDRLLSGQKWELLTEALLDCKRDHERLRKEDNAYLMYVLYSGSSRPPNMGDWQCSANGRGKPPIPAPPSPVGSSLLESDPATGVAELQTGIKRGQRFCDSPEARRAIELCAVGSARKHLEARGWSVRDVSPENRGYDLHCTRNSRGDREVLMAEVKGTVGDGGEVVLTPNEVNHARSKYPNVGLIVVSGIRLSQTPGDTIEATGGNVREINPWAIGDGVLTPIAYKYALPRRV